MADGRATVSGTGGDGIANRQRWRSSRTYRERSSGFWHEEYHSALGYNDIQRTRLYLEGGSLSYDIRSFASKHDLSAAITTLNTPSQTLLLCSVFSAIGITPD